MAFSTRRLVLGLPSPSRRVCSDGRTDRRSRDYYVTTKISRIDRLPNFFSNGAPLAGFARRLRYYWHVSIKGLQSPTWQKGRRCRSSYKVFSDLLRKQYTKPRRARRGHEAACSEKLLRLLSDRAQTLHNDRNFNSKQSYRFCFLILTVFGGKMTPQC